MERSSSLTAPAEWRRSWRVALAASLGYSIAVLHIYGLGPFFQPLEQEFGWSRAFISAGLTIAGLSGAVFSVPIGMFIDRLGPRPIGLIGVVLMTSAFALFGTATGGSANWILLWAFLSFANLWAQTTVWVAAVAGHFERSRGLALAITFSGASLTATLLPAVATQLIGAYGWRAAFPMLGGLWLVIVLPIVFLFFRSARLVPAEQPQASSGPAPVLPGLSAAEGLCTFAFYKLFLASGLFTFTAVAIVVHIVPLLRDSGADAAGAAYIAGLVGIFSIIGRLGTGFLLDRLSSHLVGALVFTLPIIACALLFFDGSNPASQAIATSIFGLTLGAEIDVIGYLTSRHFGLRHFGMFFGAMVGGLAVGSAFGPLAAGAVFDSYGSYAPFLILTMVLMAISSLALATLGRPRFGIDPHESQL